MEQNRRLCMKELPPFTGVGRAAFEAVCRRAAAKRQYHRGEILFHQGDPSNTVFLIKDGSFKLVKVTEEGRETVLAVAGKGEVLGEAALFRETPQPATAVALGEARVCAISRLDLEKVVRENPDLALGIITSLGARLYETWERVAELNAGNIREKVLTLLLRLAGEHGEPCPGGTVIKLRLTQQDIAAFIGASRVMVAQVLTDLTAAGHISKQQKYYVLKDRCF